MDVNQQEVAALERHVGDQATSPLFAKLAFLYLESGRAKDALRICDAGLAHFPFYSTAHLIKGRALKHLGLNGEARREFEFVRDWLPTNPTVAELLESVPQSDDQLLDAPPTEESGMEPVPELTVAPGAAVPGSDEVEAMQEADTSPTTPDESNVFGLPAEAPESGDQVGEETPSDGGGMDAFSQFGGGEGAMQSAGQEETFETFAERKRAMLGPTSTISIADYLAAPPAEAAVQDAQPEATDTFGGDDAFAAAGFGTPTEAPAEETAVEERQPQDPGGFGEQDPASEQPQEFDGFGEESQTGESPQEEDASVDQGSSVEHPESFAGFEPQEAPTEEAQESESAPSDAFGFPGFSADESTGSETVVRDDTSSEPATSDFFAAFVGPGEETVQQEEAETADESPEAEAPSFPDFSGMPAGEESEQTEETPETEDTSGTEPEGFSGPPMQDPVPPKPGGDRIGELAEKLQDAKKITPVIDLTAEVTSTTPSSADEAAADAGFVTPTLAEIYAKQGWYDDAINAYRTLAKMRPAEKDKFEQRVQELEEEKAKAD